MPSIFKEKELKPDEELLRGSLGVSYKYWEEIFKSLSNTYSDIAVEWKYYGIKTGWLLKLFYKKRNLFFLIPGRKEFGISFIFGDKAAAVINNSTLPDTIKSELKNARRYMEGRGIEIDVSKRNDVKNILILTEIKLEN